jgi:hypothetical protein
MADRYWVGGSGTWDASTTTNWSTTSGGAGGASAPTSADNAYFDGNSDGGAPFTVTIGTGAVCADVIIGDGVTVTALDQAMTLVGSAVWQIYGSLYFPATNLTKTHSGQLQFLATTTGHTITTNGVTLAAAESFMNGVGGEWTLGSALTVSARWLLYNGTFNTANYNCTLGAFETRAGGTKVVDLGTSTVINSTAGSPAFSIGDAADVTLSAASATIIVLANNGGFTGGGNTFGSLRFTGGAQNGATINDSGNTFTTLEITARSIAGISILFLLGDLTVTGTLHIQSGYGATFDITDTAGAITAATVNAGGEGYNVGDVLNVTGGNNDAQLTVATLSGTAIATVTISTPGTGYTTATGVATTLATSALNPNRRVLIASNTLGTARTITAAAVNITNADFRNITGAGAATWNDSSRTRYWGNALGNSGITFSAGVSKYRIGTGNWSDTQWASTSGGSPADANFPLAQDTCVFDANTTTGTHTLDQSYSIGSLSMSAVTSAITLATGSTSPGIYGNVTLDADVTLSGTGFFSLLGQGTTQTITSAGRTFTQTLSINSPSGTVNFSGASNISGRVLLTAGTLSLGANMTITNTGSANALGSNDSAFTFQAGTNTSSLVLNGYTMSISGGWGASNAVLGTRTLDFGSGGKIQVGATTGGHYPFLLANGAVFTILGTGTVEATAFSGNARVFVFGTSSSLLSTSNLINFAALAGSGDIRFESSSRVGSVDLSAQTGKLNPFGGVQIYGDLTLSAVGGITTSTTSLTLGGSSTQIFTTNGGPIGSPIIKTGANTLRLADNATFSSIPSFTLTEGTLDIDGKVMTCGNFVTNNSNTRAIAFGSGGQLVLSGSSTVFNATTGTNLTTTGTGVISLTSASSKTFAGGGRTYPTLNQGGSGTLLITGANTFANVTNTVQPTTITFPSGVTTSVQDFSVGGTLGNLVTLNASTPGSRAILNRV